MCFICYYFKKLRQTACKYQSQRFFFACNLFYLLSKEFVPNHASVMQPLLALDAHLQCKGNNLLHLHHVTVVFKN